MTDIAPESASQVLFDTQYSAAFAWKAYCDGWLPLNQDHSLKANIVSKLLTPKSHVHLTKRTLELAAMI